MGHFLPDQNNANRYLVHEEIAKGARAEVFKVFDMSTTEVVAVKVVELTGSTVKVTLATHRVTQEVHTHSSKDCPDIIKNNALLELGGGKLRSPCSTAEMGTLGNSLKFARLGRKRTPASSLRRCLQHWHTLPPRGALSSTAMSSQVVKVDSNTVAS